ncbi:hypothetical protein pdam_00005379 [Pocillopora damicornis]|uniref:Uncharacterized protein n=2 Tax=Pocillopora damicornis TaxID=46731 RepID=A0A3M6U2M1_POCDA|nr:hypothetical protein pdam_00005379 [Pocillopora damicornis]
MENRSPPDPLYVLRGTEAALNVVKFAPKSVREEGLLLSGSAKGIISLWNLKTKRSEIILDGHDGHAILAADFHPCGNVISHGRDGYLRIWQCSEGRKEVVNSITAPFLGFCQFCVLLRGYKSHWIGLPSASNSQVNIHDLESKEILFALKPDNGKSLVLCMDVDKEDLRIVSGSAGSKLCVSSVTPQHSITVEKEIELKNPGIASVKIRKDRKILATGGWDGRIRIYSWKTLKPLAYLSYHTQTINTVDFSEDLCDHGQLLAAGGKDSRISEDFLNHTVMAFRRRVRRNLILLLIFTFISVGLFFALLQTSRDVVKNRNVFQSGSTFITTSNLTTNEAPLEIKTSSVNDLTERMLQHKVKSRQVLLVVAHGRSGSTFLADIFDKHPRVFYIFEPLHGIRKMQVGDYDTFATNYLQQIFQCNFSMGNTSKEIGRFFRFYSRALSSPPFCKYKQGDPKWSRKYCSPVTQKKLEHTCKVQHNTVVYKLLLDRIPGQSLERLFHVCEMADVECKIIYLIRDMRPVVMSSQKVAFFREVDRKTRPSLRQFVYSCCEMIERNLYLVKKFPPSLRSRVRLVRYEDLAAEPLQVFDSLYRFAELEMLENIKQWIVKITQPSFADLKKEEKRPVSMIRNSLEVLNKWRLLADSCFVDVIERYCRDAMKLMGYVATDGSVEMLQNSTIPLFNENYTAQNWI